MSADAAARPPDAAAVDLPRWAPVSSPELDGYDARPVVAAFDVDGTVTTRDCVVPFLRLVGGTPALVAGFGVTGHRVVPALARRDRDQLKALAARAVFRHRAAAQVDALGRAFAATIAADRLREDTIARLRWHRAAGHEVVLVSASFGAYVRPLAERLGVHHVLATELVVDGDGRCTGQLLGANCRGVEKRRRLHEWLRASYGGREHVEVWAYGDSPGDMELLADADHAVWTGAAIPAAPP